MPTAISSAFKGVMTGGFPAPIAVRSHPLPQAALHVRARVVRQNVALNAWHRPQGALYVQTYPTIVDNLPRVLGVRAVATATAQPGAFTSDIVGVRAVATGSAVSNGVPTILVNGARAISFATAQPGSHFDGVGGERPLATASVNLGFVQIAVVGQRASATASISGALLTNSTAPFLGPYVEGSTSLLTPYYEGQEGEAVGGEWGGEWGTGWGDVGEVPNVPALAPYTEADLLLTPYNE